MLNEYESDRWKENEANALLYSRDSNFTYIHEVSCPNKGDVILNAISFDDGWLRSTSEWLGANGGTLISQLPVGHWIFWTGELGLAIVAQRNRRLAQL